MSKKKAKSKVLTYGQLKIGDVFRFGESLRGGDTIWVRSAGSCLGIFGANKGEILSVPDQPVFRYKIIPRKKNNKE